MRCMDCGYSCHEKCMESVPKNCTKYKSVADSTTSQGIQVNPGDNASVSSGEYNLLISDSNIFFENITNFEYIF